MKDLAEISVATVIHTIGYEKTTVEQFLDRLVLSEVEVLIDVRERPLSRKKGFSKKSLCEATEAVGIKYTHVQALGDPKPGRDAARTGDHALFVKIFSHHLQTNEALEAARDVARSISGKKICLACFERDHTRCHRTMVAELLSEMTGAPVVHLEV